MFAELATAAAAALGGAVATDAWGWVKGGFQQVFQRGGTSDAVVEKWLEDTAVLVSAAPTAADDSRGTAAALEQVRARWAARVEDLLDAHPELASTIEALVERAREESVPGTSQARVVQHVEARDHAQQAVQGQGVQNVTFGSGS
jgi:hypothetical protein